MWCAAQLRKVLLVEARRAEDSPTGGSLRQILDVDVNKRCRHEQGRDVTTKRT